MASCEIRCARGQGAADSPPRERPTLAGDDLSIAMWGLQRALARVHISDLCGANGEIEVWQWRSRHGRLADRLLKPAAILEEIQAVEADAAYFHARSEEAVILRGRRAELEDLLCQIGGVS